MGEVAFDIVFLGGLAMKKFIDGEWEGVTDHSRDKFFQEGTVCSNGWVGVSLDESDFELSIDEEVIAEDFKMFDWWHH